MNKTSKLFAAATLIAGVTSAAHAGKVHITADDMDFNIKSTSLPGLFGSAGTNHLTGAELANIHASINAAGIATEGYVTFLLADTSQGLSLIALVDNNMTSGPKDANAVLGIATSVSGADSYLNNDFNFMANGGTYTDIGSTQTLAGNLSWHPDGGATGMAWTGLSETSDGSFDFTAFLGDEVNASTFAGLTESNTFQFLSWTGSTWNLKRTASFDSEGSFGFAFAVVPVPPALGLGLAGLGLLGVMRRRRKNRRA